jgi:hypothetical protein
LETSGKEKQYEKIVQKPTFLRQQAKRVEHLQPSPKEKSDTDFIPHRQYLHIFTLLLTGLGIIFLGKKNVRNRVVIFFLNGKQIWRKIVRVTLLIRYVSVVAKSDENL